MMVTFDRELLVMPDGGTIALDWACKQKENTTVLTDSSPVILLCHGLVGDSQSEYIYHLSRRLMRAGYRAVVMVARGCGGLHLTSGGIFAGRRTSDIAACIHHIDDKYPQAKLFCVGFSLGAALTLQYLAEEHVPDSPKGSTFQGMSHWEAYAPVTAAVVVSPPWDIKTNSLVPRLIPSLWSYLLVVPLKVYFLLHYETLQRESPELYGKISLWNVLSCLTMADFERLCYNCHYRASGGTYGSIEAYYNDISPLHSAHYVHTPTLSLTSMDDPICMHEHCPSSTGSSSSGGGGGGDGEEDEQSAATTNTIGPGLIVVKTPYGGHLAYPGGFFPITSAWTDRIIVEWFRQFL